MTTIADQSDIAEFPLWVWAVLAAVVLAVALIPLVARSAASTPQAAAGRVREWWDREGVDLDAMDGVRRCWSTGPRGSHAYASTVDGAWQCMRCGDRVERGVS